MEFKIMDNEITMWLSINWKWILLVFMVANTIVKASPSKADDIIIDILFKGLQELAGKTEKEKEESK